MVLPVMLYKHYLVNNEVYFLCGYTSGSPNPNVGNYFYKYNFETNQYTRLTDVPIGSNYWAGYCTTSYGDCIYAFNCYNGSSGNWSAYKYDTKQGSWSQIANTPISVMSSPAIGVNNKIYIFDDSNTLIYDIANNSYIKLTKAPNSLLYQSACRVCVIDTNIYLFNSTIAYKYDTLTDTYTQITDLSPIDMTDGNIAVNKNKIYLFKETTCYVFNPDDNSFIQLENIPTSLNISYCSYNIVKDNIIYLFNTTKVQTFRFPVKDYADNSIIIETGTKSKSTEFITTNVVNGIPLFFDNFYYYTTKNGLDTEIEKYYGNGEKWIQL